LLKGCQDKDIEKQVITPSVVRLSNKEQNNFREQGDLMKIRGFITNLQNIDKLKKLDLTIMFGHDTYNIPFSFLIKYNNLRKNCFKNYECEISDDYFIEFPHDILLKHKIPLISLTFSSFTIFIKELDENMIVDMVLDTYILDVDTRKEAAIIEKMYNIKSVQEFKIHLMGSTYKNEPCTLCIYESDITPKFLTQGIIINYPKHKIVNLLITNSFLLILFLTLYVNWYQINSRFDVSRLVYEESSWYDTQIWEKPFLLIKNDKLLKTQKIQPIIQRLSRVILMLFFFNLFLIITIQTF
jgi:hypothetical protein